MKNVVAQAITPAVAPGQQAVHYAPHARAFRFDTSDGARVPRNAATIRVTTDAVQYSKAFYATLRDLDAQNPPAIYIEMPPDEPAWAAVRDRILRATKPL